MLHCSILFIVLLVAISMMRVASSGNFNPYNQKPFVGSANKVYSSTLDFEASLAIASSHNIPKVHLAQQYNRLY